MISPYYQGLVRADWGPAPGTAGLYAQAGESIGRGIADLGMGIGRAMENYGQLKKEAKAADAMRDAMKTTDPITGKEVPSAMGIPDDKWDSLSWKDKSAHAQGFVKAMTLKSVMSEMQTRALENEMRRREMTGNAALPTMMAKMQPSFALRTTENRPFSLTDTAPPASGPWGMLAESAMPGGESPLTKTPGMGLSEAIASTPDVLMADPNRFKILEGMMGGKQSSVVRNYGGTGRDAVIGPDGKFLDWATREPLKRTPFPDGEPKYTKDGKLYKSYEEDTWHQVSGLADSIEEIMARHAGVDGKPTVPSPQSKVTPTDEAIAYLKENPDTKASFDEMYGEGAAAKILAQ